eukprot:Em0017g436a
MKCVSWCKEKFRKLRITKRLLKVYVACFFSLFSSAYSITMLFPFLPFMTRFLRPDVDEASISKYAGIVAASLFAGRFFGSYIWGAIADYTGRKPVMVVSGVLLGIVSIGFGFSINYEMAIAFRFLVGITNGIIGTGKAVLSESSNDENQAFGMSLLACSWGLGLVIGPALSGISADPLGQYNISLGNDSSRSFLTSFPYSPPCLINGLICFAASGVVLWLLPETLDKKTKSEVLKLEEQTPDQDTQADVSPLLESSSSSSSSSSIELCEDLDIGTLGSKMKDTESDDEDRGEETKATHPSLPSNQKGARSGGMGAQSLKVLGRARGAQALTREDSQGEVEEKDILELAEMEPVDLEEEENPEQRSSRLRLPASLTTPTPSQGPHPLVAALPCDHAHHEQHHPHPHRLTQHPHGHRPSVLAPFFDRKDVVVPTFVKVRRSHRHHRSDPSDKEGVVPGEHGGVRFDGSRVELGGAAPKSRAGKVMGGVKTWARDFKALVSDRVTLLTVTAYCIFSFAVIGFDEIYSLWCATAIHLGGLGLSLLQIGVSLMVVGGVLLPFTLFTYPIMEKKFGSIQTFQINAILLVIFTILLPNIHFLAANSQPSALWAGLLIVMLCIRVTMTTCFAAQGLLINNSVTHDKLGSVNGLAMSATALLRTIAPIFGGGLYSVSLTENAIAIGFPVDYNLIFIIFSVVYLSVIFMTACFPLSLDHQKIVKKEGD